MTTKERLHELVDELSDQEADDALRLIEARRADEWWTQKPVEIKLSAAETAHLLDVLEHPERSEAGLRDLFRRASQYQGE